MTEPYIGEEKGATPTEEKLIYVRKFQTWGVPAKKFKIRAVPTENRHDAIRVTRTLLQILYIFLVFYYIFLEKNFKISIH